MFSFASIRKYPRLLLIVGALCIPVLILAGLFANQGFKDIRFSQRELIGADYLRPAWETLSALYNGDATGAAPTLDEAAARHNPTLGLQTEYAHVRRTLDAACYPEILANKPACDIATLSLRNLVTQISDASYLTLDPRIDTYYLMNTAVTVLPEFEQRNAAVLQALQAASLRRAVDEQTKANIQTELILLGLAADNTTASLNSAMRGNADGKLSSNVTPALVAFTTAQSAYLTRARALAARITAGQSISSADLAALRPYHDALHTQTNHLWQTTTDNLERRLKVRLTGDRAKLWGLLGITALIAAAALFLVVYLDLYVQHAEILKLNATLTQSNEELDRFAYICSHDLQEPVRMMNAYAGFLETDAENLSADDRRYVGYIRDNALRMQKMISDILDFSRIGREEIRDERVDCNAVLQTVLTRFADIIAKTSAKITSGDLPVLMSNATLVGVLFQNLIGNALKFQDGRHPPEINISARRDGTMWRFEISDNGIGIDEAFNEKVFTLFQRLNRKEDYPGTGIGLSTCRKFIRLCGGDMGFTSKPGGGTLFFFTIPV